MNPKMLRGIVYSVHRCLVEWTAPTTKHKVVKVVFYYNFPLPDFEACTPARLVDIVTVMIYELTRGKVAVHCHAGHGRTGMVIAACMMLLRGMTPREAVDFVRQKRPGSVQSSDQVEALHSLHVLLFNDASVLPQSPFRSTSEYVEFTGRVLPRMDTRRYGKLPKPLFVGFVALLRKFFSAVVLRPQSQAENAWRFQFDCSGPTDFKYVISCCIFVLGSALLHANL
ncbi:dual specificity phosphatase, catalytic domain protein [Ostertagia ostertagi]